MLLKKLYENKGFVNYLVKGELALVGPPLISRSLELLGSHMLIPNVAAANWNAAIFSWLLSVVTLNVVQPGFLALRVAKSATAAIFKLSGLLLGISVTVILLG